MYFVILVFLFIFAVIFAPLFLLYKKTGRNIPVSKLADANYTPYPFKLVAIGSALAFFPSVVGIVFEFLKAYFGIRILPYSFFDQFLMGLFVQVAGAFIMTLGFLYLYRWSRVSGSNRPGLKLAIIGSALGILMNFKILIFELIVGREGVQIDLLAFLVISVIMAVACLMLSRDYTRFKALGISFILSAIIILMIYFGPGSYLGYYDSIYVLLFFMTHDYIVFVPLILVLIFSAQTILGLRIFGAKLRSGIVSDKPQSRAGVNNSGLTVSAKPTADNDDILMKLMGYDDARLKSIIDNPRFHSAAVVDRAREILGRREAWEQIKDLPDNQLLEMTMADKGLYEDNIVEAASMELYQRDSSLLSAQFAALSPDIVAGIANGIDPAPEGIRLAARKFMLNNSHNN